MDRTSSDEAATAALSRLRAEERHESAQADDNARREAELERQRRVRQYRDWREFLESERANGYPTARLVRYCRGPVNRKSFWRGRIEHKHEWHDGLGYWAGSTHSESGDRGYTTNWIVLILSEAALVVATAKRVVGIGADNRLELFRGLELCPDSHGTRSLPLIDAPPDL